MASSLIAINQGLLYQESIFWWQAAIMLTPGSSISSIEWEADDLKGFDDVVVNYDPPILDKATGEKVTRDVFQVKHHADKSRFITCEALTDPSFIGAISVSFLKKLKNQQDTQTDQKQNIRYNLVNTWSIDASDTIGKLIGTDGEIRLEVLKQGKTDDSEMGRVRKLWREHLQLADDQQLFTCLSSLRITSNFFDVHSINYLLNPNLRLAGLHQLSENQVSNKYDGLIARLHGQKKNIFTEPFLRELCKREGLFAPESSDYLHRVGIRTFLSGTEHFNQENAESLCLAHHYEDRKIKDPLLWSSQVLPELKSFLKTVTEKQKKITFSLETHLSLAFAAGYCLNPKQGVQVSVIQKTQNSKILWEPKINEQAQENMLSWTRQVVNPGCNDVAVAISITHNIMPDVEFFVTDQLPQVGKIIEARINPGPSHSALKDGTHVFHLAQTIANELYNSRTIQERNGKVHIFMAAPNAFAFYFGQYAAALGNMVLYEFNFPAIKAGDYHPVLTFPN